MTQPVVPLSVEPARWLVERGREARQLAAQAPDGPQRQGFLAIADVIDRTLFARGLTEAMTQTFGKPGEQFFSARLEVPASWAEEQGLIDDER